jgi:hypothetical protein
VRSVTLIRLRLAEIRAKALRPKEEGLYRITSRFFYKVSKFISDISDIYHFLKNMHAFGLIFIL